MLLSTDAFTAGSRLFLAARLASIVLLAGLAMLPLLSFGQAVITPDGMELSSDGAWCWFQDERAVIVGDYLLVGSVASGHHDDSRKGNIEVIQHNLRSHEPLTIWRIHEQFLNRNGAYDDHNAPALLPLGGGRALVVHAMHGDENRFYAQTISWEDRTLRGDRTEFVPSEKSRITYSNLYHLSEENAPTGRIYNFYRGLDDSFKPSYAWSDDLGKSWNSGNVFIDVPSEFRHRPYVKYASNGKDTVHFFYTEGHPRNYNTSVYHVFYRKGMLHKSDGTPIRSLREGLKRPEEGTLIYQGDADNVAWTSDIQLDRNGHPYVAFTVQKNAAGLPAEKDGMDHRYHVARWDGIRWTQHEIAFAGTRLYAREGDYTGNIALDPNDPAQVFISTNANPSSGQPLVSEADGKRHWELYRGRTNDGGESWRWTALTSNSREDHLRPIVPAWDNAEELVLLWLRGEYRTYTDYSQAVMMRRLSRPSGNH